MISFKTKKSKEYDKKDVLKLFKVLDSYFEPLLSQRVNLQEYINKLDQYATMVLAYNESDILTGLIAFYDNDQENKEAYITYLAVLPEFQGNGIANKLLEYCVMECQKKGMNLISVETWENNVPVIQLYKKFGFEVKDKVADRINSNSLKLRKEL